LQVLDKDFSVFVYFSGSTSPTTEVSGDTAYGSAADQLDSSNDETLQRFEPADVDNTPLEESMEGTNVALGPGRPSTADVENNNVDAASFSMSGDPNYLGRMIIQQLPKRLELLKQENESLLTEASEATMKAKEAERKLKQEQCKNNQITLELEGEVKRKNLKELELREQLEYKEQEVIELKKDLEQMQQKLNDSKQ